MPKELDKQEKSILLGQLKMINERLKVVGSDEDRLNMIQTLKDGICPECGRIDDNCQCWNDE